MTDLLAVAWGKFCPQSCHIVVAQSWQVDRRPVDEPRGRISRARGRDLIQASKAGSVTRPRRLSPCQSRLGRLDGHDRLDPRRPSHADWPNAWRTINGHLVRRRGRIPSVSPLRGRPVEAAERDRDPSAGL